MIYNIFAGIHKKKQLPLDKWQILDLINAIFTIGFVMTVVRIPYFYLDATNYPKVKYYLNYFSALNGVI